MWCSATRPLGRLGPGANRGRELRASIGTDGGERGERCGQQVSVGFGNGGHGSVAGLHCGDLELESDLVADEDAARIEGRVPGESPFLAAHDG